LRAVVTVASAMQSRGKNTGIVQNKAIAGLEETGEICKVIIGECFGVL
jgi:hypothetical protein